MGYNVMIVDDAAFMRFVLERILREHRYKIVAEAASGREAVERYKTYRPDLVIMDITMPESGIDAVKQIIAFDPSAKVLMCSAMGQAAMIKEAIMSGAKDFLVKPLERERVVEAVVKLIGVPPEPTYDEDIEEVEDPVSGEKRKMSNLERRLRYKLSRGID